VNSRFFRPIHFPENLILRGMKKPLSNWSNYPIREAEVVSLRGEKDIARLLQGGNMIPRGLWPLLRRCFAGGECSVTTCYSNILSFDPVTGIICCEAGTSLKDLLDIFVPRGWFLPVTPGTKFITVGGAVASDVHRKNHHAEGAFSNHVLSMQVYTPAFGVMSCGPSENPDLFNATCGGMGLTVRDYEYYLSAEEIESAFIRQKTDQGFKP